MGPLFLTPQLWYEGMKDTCIKTFILFYTQHVQVNTTRNYMAPVKKKKKNPQVIELKSKIIQA